LYYLCTEINEELEHFVRTGKQPEEEKGTNKEYCVFAHGKEELMVSRWAGLGMTVTYHRQQVELVDRITITYMKVQNPKTGLSISIIPWFLVAGRPYPIFVYIYAIGYYHQAEVKSLGESAAAVKKMFGVSGFHKSTISRSIRAMEGFIDASMLDQPLAAEGLKKAEMTSNWVESDKPCENVIDAIAEILASYPTFEALEKEIGGKVKRLPKPIKRTGGTSLALSGIPNGPFNIIMPDKPGGRPSHDHRKRPPRPRAKGTKPVQRPLKFIDRPQREEKRKAFIAICHHLTLNAAIIYHRFLV